MYMKPVLIVSGLGSLSAWGTMMIVGTHAMKDTAIILTVLKGLTVAITTILFTLLSSRDMKFFYINVGISYEEFLCPKFSHYCSEHAGFAAAVSSKHTCHLAGFRAKPCTIQHVVCAECKTDAVCEQSVFIRRVHDLLQE